MFPPRPTVLRSLWDLLSGGREGRRRRGFTAARTAFNSLTLPYTAWALAVSRDVHPDHDVRRRDLLRLAWRMHRNSTRVFCGTSPRAHLAIAVKLLELPPDVEGVVVECGSFLGGSTANLSLVCDLVGRDLIVYDSFEGLPEAEEADRFAVDAGQGLFAGDLETVKANVAAHGAPERCTFRKGWFDATLPDHAEPIALAYLDVDFQASIHTCLVHLWPHLVDDGFWFTDDFQPVGVAAVYFDERFWAEHFDEKPPGLLGGRYRDRPRSGLDRPLPAADGRTHLPAPGVPHHRLHPQGVRRLLGVRARRRRRRQVGLHPAVRTIGSVERDREFAIANSKEPGGLPLSRGRGRRPPGRRRRPPPGRR